MNFRPQLSLSGGLADGLALLLSLAIGPWLRQRFGYLFVQDLSFTGIANALILAGAYLLFLVGVWQVLKIRPAGSPLFPWVSSRNVRVTAALIAVAVVGTALADLSGFIDSARGLVNFGELGNATYMLFSGGIFIFFPLVYLLLLLNPVEQTVDPSNTGRISLCLLLINMLALTLVAYVRAAIGRLFPVPAAFILWPLAASIPLFGRMLHADLTHDVGAIASFLVMLTLITFV